VALRSVGKGQHGAVERGHQRGTARVAPQQLADALTAGGRPLAGTAQAGRACAVVAAVVAVAARQQPAHLVFQ
jgi:hypothetical protein